MCAVLLEKSCMWDILEIVVLSFLRPDMGAALKPSRLAWAYWVTAYLISACYINLKVREPPPDHVHAPRWTERQQ
jgi:hypothetical protein